ncbi:MAG: NADH-quinone oxidoreductase subunit L [Candidatus Omnitrophica bacterium]|nr:NADH-quinone oxidoreductase subunit L [Candidatus Omnitrophota bacterium]
MEQHLLLLILLPLAGAVLILSAPQRMRFFKAAPALVITLVNMAIAIIVFKKNIIVNFPWAGFGIDLSFRLDHFSAFIIAAVACFSFLVTLYSSVFMRLKPGLKQFYAYLLINLSFTNGALLADNLIILLFFWEGLLLGLFGMIALGNKNSWQTAIKAFIIVGIADLCMLLGIAITGHLSGTLAISKINLPLASPLAIFAFIMLMIGAISKAGSMPFHTWIPDAAVDAPLPFMAFLPASLEKLLGIYFLGRISLSMFQLKAESGLSIALMVIGVTTIICAVMMALIQKNYKKLLAYHAVSQVGYMILGIGTCLPVGIVGGLFHMLNNAMYKSCLFFTGGAVEKEAGTANLEELGGLSSKMPITFFCFVIAALSISGVPPFNGFFSKELIYDAALERGAIFYFLAVLGSFFTAASFLKLGHAAYLGKLNPVHQRVKEAPLAMLIPMITIALACVLFGLFNSWPLDNLIQPVLGQRLEGISFSGFPANTKLIVITIVVLIFALLNHIFGSKIYGSGLKAADYIHYAPGLVNIYAWAEKGYFDPYRVGMKFIVVVAKVIFLFDRGIDWLSSSLFVNLSYGLTGQIRKVHTGNYAHYLSWSLLGMFLIAMFLLYKH